MMVLLVVTSSAIKINEKLLFSNPMMKKLMLPITQGGTKDSWGKWDLEREF